MLRHLSLVGLLCLTALTDSRAAQPDYTNALWASAYPGHWYTTGYAHAFVVVHDMEGYYLSTISYFQQSNTQASAHFCVNGLKDNANDSPAGEITQMVEEQYWAWHVRCWNRYMFGIEHEGFVSNPAWFTDAMYQSSGALTRHLCDTWSIPIDRNHIIGHNEYQNPAWLVWMTNNWPQIDPTCNNHTDPGQYWDWAKYMAQISGAPGITVQPWSRLVEPGSNVTFSVLAAGDAPLRYQWRRNGQTISGATSTNYVLTNVQAADAAGYSVVVTNASGSVTSRIAKLSVSPPWIPVFADTFETNSAANWSLFWGAGNGIPDYTTNWAFDYSTNVYVANGATNFIPPAPNSGGTTHGLKITVNKNDAVAATAAVSLYPKNLVFSNDYVLRFDMWINYNGGAGGGTGSTEYGTFGLNHAATEVNWTTNATASDGLWFAVDGEGGSGGSDYRAYLGTGAAPPTQLTFANGGLAASGANSDNAGDPFYRSIFPSPTYETAGAPGKHWVQGELSQINNVVTWQFNGVVVAQRTNTSPYTRGDMMIGYMDPFTSIANPPADNFVIFDNVRVLISAASAAVNNLTITPRSSSAIVQWTSLMPTACRIEYGTAPAYGSLTPLEPSSRTNHTLLLNGLVPRANYVFRIHSFMDTTELLSAQYAFSTDVGAIVDNPQATYFGNWTLSASAPDQYGVDFQYATTTTDTVASAEATYTPALPTTGKYDVLVWYPQGPNRSTNAHVSLFYDDGFLSTAVNQTTAGGAWRLVASGLDFVAGTNGFVTIGNDTGESDKIIAADAFRWAYVASQDIPADGTVPAWWSSYYFGTNFVDATLDPDHDGYTTYMEYVLGTDPTDPASRFSTAFARAGDSLQFLFTPCQGGRTYELQSTANLPGGPWLSLPDVPVVTNGQGAFTLPNTGAPGPRFFRIAVHLTP